MLSIFILLFIAFVLGSQNPQLIKINYILASAELSLAVVISICFVTGVIVGTLISLRLFTTLKWQNFRLKTSNKKLIAEKET
jgi:putative membrane protein